MAPYGFFHRLPSAIKGNSHYLLFVNSKSFQKKVDKCVLDKKIQIETRKRETVADDKLQILKREEIYSK